MSSELEQFQQDITAIEHVSKFTRRNLLKGAVMFGALAADYYATERLHAPRNHTEIMEIEDPSAMEKFPDTAWLLLPGFKKGWEDSYDILESVAPSLRNYGRTLCMGYSNEGLNRQEIKEKTVAYAKKEGLTTINLYGHSFGGMLAIELAVHLQQNTDISVNMIMLDSSPSGREDVLGEHWFDWLVRSEKTGVAVPTFLRLCGEAGELIVNKNERTWRQIGHQAIEQVSSSAPSTKLIQSEAAYIAQFSAQDYADLDPSTDIVILANVNDDTIDFPRAIFNWQRALPNNFRRNYSTKGVWPTHASSKWNKGTYQEQVDKALYDFFVLTDEQRYQRH